MQKPDGELRKRMAQLRKQIEKLNDMIDAEKDAKSLLKLVSAKEKAIKQWDALGGEVLHGPKVKLPPSLAALKIGLGEKTPFSPLFPAIPNKNKLDLMCAVLSGILANGNPDCIREILDGRTLEEAAHRIADKALDILMSEGDVE